MITHINKKYEIVDVLDIGDIKSTKVTYLIENNDFVCNLLCDTVDDAVSCVGYEHANTTYHVYINNEQDDLMSLHFNAGLIETIRIDYDHKMVYFIGDNLKFKFMIKPLFNTNFLKKKSEE